MGLIPKNERRVVENIEGKIFWLYGDPYVGKTFLLNTFPNVLMLNTDGNAKFVDAPSIPIVDENEGRVPKSGWDKFNAVVDELALRNNDFEWIGIDLLEDVHKFARNDVFKREGINHESDMGFGKGWKLVDDEFFKTFTKLKGLGYNICLLSHTSMGDVTKKNGEKITRYTPDVREKTAIQIAGMVDFTGRFVAEDEERTISIKRSEFQFGGGRREFAGKVIPATYDAIMAMYDSITKPETVVPVVTEETPVQEEVAASIETPLKRKIKRKDDGE